MYIHTNEERSRQIGKGRNYHAISIQKNIQDIQERRSKHGLKSTFCRPNKMQIQQQTKSKFVKHTIQTDHKISILRIS